MACKKCSNVPKFDYCQSNVYMTSSTDHLLPKMVKVLKMLKYSYTLSENHMVISVPSYELFLEELLKGDFFNALENREIKLLPLEGTESLSFDHFGRTQTLEEWLTIITLRDYIQLIDQKRIKTLFQPIIRTSNLECFGHEALSRGLLPDGRLMSAKTLFKNAKTLDLLFNLDRQCRETAVHTAAQKGLTGHLFINFIPTAIFDPKECLQSTVEAIKSSQLKASQIVFEVVESEQVESHSHLRNILNYYREQGFKTALDDVGTGFSTIEAYHALDTNFIKISIEIIRNIDHDLEKQACLDQIMHLKYNNGVAVIAEGVEKVEEFNYLKSKGVDFVQGYYFGKPE